MSLDHVATIQREAARTLAAYEANPAGKLPWSDRWTVNTVTRHLAAAHHVVAQIIEDRPTADFGRHDTLVRPPKGDATFPAWFAAGTDALVEQCRTAPPGDLCWSPLPEGVGTVAYWTRRMANETLVHRWDAEAGAGVAGGPMDGEVAADAIDEYLDLAARVARGVRRSPSGPAIHIACADAGREWYLDLREPGQRTLHDEPIEVELALRGRAEDLLLLFYGRIGADGAAVEVTGDGTILERWAELVPPI